MCWTQDDVLSCLICQHEHENPPQIIPEKGHIFICSGEDLKALDRKVTYVDACAICKMANKQEKAWEETESGVLAKPTRHGG